MPSQIRFKKKPALAELWREVKDEVGAPYIFDSTHAIRASRITGFKNHNDLVKIDTYEDLCDSMKEDDFFIVHRGGPSKKEQTHQFVRGARRAYRTLDMPSEPLEEISHFYSPLDEIDQGEADSLSMVYNHRLIENFVYHTDTARMSIHLPGRTSSRIDNSFTYFVGTERIDVQSLQIEMDFIVEKNGDVVFAEAKRGPLWSNFGIAQVYLPYRKLLNIKNRVQGTFTIRPMFVMHYQAQYEPTTRGFQAGRYDHIRLLEYRFLEPDRMDSIELVGAKEFVVLPRGGTGHVQRA